MPPAEVADLRASLDERGLTEYLSSELGGAKTTLHDGSATLGHDIEIHADNPGFQEFFSMVRSAPPPIGKALRHHAGSRPDPGVNVPAQPIRRRPESNRCTRLCRPLRSHSATSPRACMFGSAIAIALVPSADPRAISSAGRAPPPRQGGGHWFRARISPMVETRNCGVWSFTGTDAGYQYER